MSPAEQDIFFKRMFALGIPKDSRLNIFAIGKTHGIYNMYNISSHCSLLQEHLHKLNLVGWSQHPGLSSPRCLQVIIFLVLLVAWMEDPADIDIKQNIEVIEYFSGVGRIAKVADYSGYCAVGFDMVDGVSKAKKTGRRNPLDLNSNAGLVLAIKLVLRCRFDACVAFFAILCSSFVPVNRGTGCRDLLVPEGDEHVVSVRKSNKLLSRNLG